MKISVIEPEDFDALLKWLCEDRDEAGEKYEKVRRGLIKYFDAKGCADPEFLTDETLNRVAKKIPRFDAAKTSNNISFIYGFARNIKFEYFLSVKKEAKLNEAVTTGGKVFLPEILNESVNDEYVCLDKCLGKLSEADRKLMVQYYCEDKGEKIMLRKKISEDINLTVKALHTKIYRLRIPLRKCIEQCLGK